MRGAGGNLLNPEIGHAVESKIIQPWNATGIANVRHLPVAALLRWFGELFCHDGAICLAKSVGDKERVFPDFLHFCGIKIGGITVGDHVSEGCNLNSLVKAKCRLGRCSPQPISNLVSPGRYFVGNLVRDFCKPDITALD